MPITCLVNLFHLDPPSNGGASRIAKYVSKLLLEQGLFVPENVVFAVGTTFAKECADWLGYEASRLIVIPCPEVLGVPELLRTWHPNLIVSPLFGCDPFTPPAVNRHIPHIAAIPDTHVLDCPEDFEQQQREQLRTTYSTLAEAAHVVTISEFMRRRLLELLPLDPARVHVAPLSLSHCENLGPTNFDVRSFRPYFFYPANGWKHKRHALLLEIMKAVWIKRPDTKVVLTGHHDTLLGELLEGETQSIRERIIDLGYLDEASVAELYRNAEALLFVSNYEGFGLPILEAMGFGCPVICKHTTAIPEVADNAALFVDSDKPEDWAHAALVDLPRCRESLIAAGYARVKAFPEENTRRTWMDVLKRSGPRETRPHKERNLPPSGIVVPMREVVAQLNQWLPLIKQLDAKEDEIQRLANAWKATNDMLNVHVQLVQEKEAEIQRLANEWKATNDLLNVHVQLVQEKEAEIRRLAKELKSASQPPS